MDTIIQPFKKRIIELPIVYTQPLYDRTANRRELPQIQSIQYLPLNESVKNATVSQQNQIPSQKTQQTQQAQVVHIKKNEQPMLLNAWTQTIKSEELPPNPRVKALLEKIKQLERTIIDQAAQLSKVPKQSIPKSKTSLEPSYRIVNKIQGPNNETQFEIEIQDQSIEIKEEIQDSSEKENQIVEQLYSQITTSTPKCSSKRRKQSKKVKKQEKEKEVTHAIKKEFPPLNFTSDGKYVIIGPNGTRIPTDEFNEVTWEKPSISTRDLLLICFGSEVLSTHSMTGRPSPALKNDLTRPVKKPLNQKIVQDITYAILQRFEIREKEVRSFITTKCADQNKLEKLKAQKQLADAENEENENKGAKARKQTRQRKGLKRPPLSEMNSHE